MSRLPPSARHTAPPPGPLAAGLALALAAGLTAGCDPTGVLSGGGDGLLVASDAGPHADWPQVHDGAPRLDGAPRDGAQDGSPSPDSTSPPDATPPDAAPPPSYPERYGPTVHSPITPYVAQQLRDIASKAPGKLGRRFSKLGNSITVSTWFLQCFAGSNITWGTHQALSTTVNHFKVDLGGGVTPFDRTSLCATVGWSASSALAGSPSPLQQEIAAITPRFAVVMYGTNEVGWISASAYANNMLTITDTLIGQGVIPLLTLIPPRDDDASADAKVPQFNAVVRGIGQGRQVPVIDLHQELLKLPHHGIGGDGVHLNATGGGCDLSAQGLQHGYNMRNLLTLQALDRVKRVVVDGAAAPESPGPPLGGKGTKAEPFRIEALPFTDMRNTSGWSQSLIASYSCAPSADESGPEFYYRLELTKPTALRAMVLDQGSVDIDIHLLGASPTGQSCIQRDDTTITAQLQPGVYHLVLDTYVNKGVPKPGEYLLVVLTD